MLNALTNLFSPTSLCRILEFPDVPPSRVLRLEAQVGELQ
jgi:hypothetical protein